MSISNLSIDRSASTEELATMANDYRASLTEASTDPHADDSYVEWLESGLEIIEGELAERESRDRAADLLALLEFTEGEIAHVLDAARAQGEVMTSLHHGNARVEYRAGIYTVTP